MASPFRIFRKYLKPLMVFFGVLIMFSFVILDPLASFLTGGRGRDINEDPSRDIGAVAASWEGGSLTNRELGSLVVRRAIVRAFLDQVEGLGARSSLMAGIEPPPLRVIQLQLPETAQQGVEQSVVRTKLFSDAARKAGMSVDDNAIVQYLIELGRGRVTKDDMRQIIESFNSSNRQVSIEYVFDGLRDELLARNFLMSNRYAAETVTPQQRWQDWLKVNDRAIVEVAALPVESYLVEVKDPPIAELQKFYDEYKDDEAGPDRVDDMELPSVRPGFRVPRKIDVQFVRANFDDLVTKTEGEITDEEIAKFYEENKDLFIKADRGFLDDVPAAEEALKSEVPATENAPAGESDADKAGASDADSKGGESADAGVKSGTEGVAAPTEEAPNDEAAPQTPPDETPPATPVETPPATEEGSDEPAPGDADQSKRQGASYQTVFRQVAFLQEEEAESSASEAAAPPAEESATTGAEATPAAETAAAEDAAPAVETAPAADPAASTEATPPAASTEPATTAETPATPDATAAPGATPPVAAPPVAEEPKAAEKPPEYQPLEEVREIIRHNLAIRRADEKIRTQMDEVMGELNKEFETYFDKVLRADSDTAERPAPHAALADLAPLMEKHGLTGGKTGPMTVLEFRETPVGKSLESDTSFELFRILFGRTDKELYQPILAANASDGDRYIVMKTSDTPSRVPELTAVKSEVQRAWKLREAAKFALKDAEKQAADAQKAGSSLADFYAQKPAIQVERIDPFSYYTPGDVPDQFNMSQRYRLSQPDGIVAAGPELLGQVFELKDGEVGAALNHDHSIAYVIRVIEHLDAPESLRNEYLGEARTWDGLPAMSARHVSQAANSIFADLAGSEGVDWKRAPDNLRDDEDAAE